MDTRDRRSKDHNYPPRIYGKDHFDLGRNAAVYCGGAMKRVIAILSRWARMNPGEYGRITRGLSDRGVALSTVYPEKTRELEGAARGLNMSFDDILAAREVIDSCIVPCCTTGGAVRPATRDGGAILSWNFDAPFSLKTLFGRHPLFVREVEGTIPYLCVGRPWFWSMGILNAEGLGCVVNGVGIRDDGEGLTPFELNARVMETCASVEEAARVIRRGPRQATRAMNANMLLNWNTIWSDKNGSLSLFEYSHSHFHRQRAGDEGILASANHHQFLDRGLSGSFDPLEQEMIAGSYSRLARAWALLRINRGEIDQRAAKAIASDHIPDYSLLSEFGMDREWWEKKVDDSTICAHAWNTKAHLRRGKLAQAFMERQWSCTMYSFQIQPEEHVVWFTDGHPCRNDTLPIYWGKTLGADSQQPSYALLPSDLLKNKPEKGRRGMFMRDTRYIDGLRTRQWLFVTDLIERGAFRDLGNRKQAGDRG